MAESITDTNPPEQPNETIEATPENTHLPVTIWTPRFIIIFALTLVIGLSAESLLTQGWLNKLYEAEWVLLAHALLLLGCWITVTILARSPWLRIGGIFGCIWVIFTLIGLLMKLFYARSTAGIHLHAATSSALLATYICLSSEHIPFQRWDSWFFRIIPIFGAGAIAIAYFLLPTEIRPLRELEAITTTVLLYLCNAVWWLRPSCWTSQACATFFFGIAPLLAIFNSADPETSFFFSQVLLLSILLGTIRVVQGELAGRW